MITVKHVPVGQPNEKMSMSCAKARGVMQRFTPGFPKGRRWSKAHFVALGAIFGLRDVQLEVFAGTGVRYPVWSSYLTRLRRAFDVAEKWLGCDTILFFTAPNTRLGERPIDFLKHSDSFEKMLHEIVRECGTTMESVESHLAS